MRNITWDDLTIILNIKDAKNAYEDWHWRLNGKFQPLLITKFGDLIFTAQRRQGIFFGYD